MSPSHRPSLESLAAEVRRGHTKAEAVIEAAVAAHEDHGAELGAYVEWGGESALARAREIDAQVSRGEDPGHLAGIPVSVKDLYGVDGFRTRAGTSTTLPEEWTREGFLVSRIKKAGGIVVGKTHTVEMAYGGVGINPHRGTPWNPWDAEQHRVPGGSSSGAGVSLLEGSAVVALGSDTGGSVRIPASATGTFGNRTTVGRWPTTGVVPLSRTLDTVGALTRTAEDAAYLFSAVDGASVPAMGIDRLRIGVPASSRAWNTAALDVARVVLDAVQELGARGARVEELDIPELDLAEDLYLRSGVVSAECAAFLRRSLPDVPAILDKTVASRLESALELPASDYLDALVAQEELSERIQAYFEDWDLLITPTLPLTPPTVDSLSELTDYLRVNRRMLANTSPVSLLGLCAASIPAGLDDSGMPAGLQMIAQGGRDPELLGWAVAAEQVLGTPLVRLGTPPRLG